MTEKRGRGRPKGSKNKAKNTEEIVKKIEGAVDNNVPVEKNEGKEDKTGEEKE